MPSIKTDKDILDTISDPEVYGSPEYNQAKTRLGVDDSDVEKYKIATEFLKENPEDQMAIKARNQIYNKVASNRPAVNVQGVGSLDRFAIKNLISDEPVLQQRYLEKKGYQTRVVNGEVEVKKPDQASFQKIDPDGLDWLDATDLLSDVIEGGIAGAAGAAGFTIGGPGGAFALGGAGAATAETLRQAVAKYSGLREELNPIKSAEAGFLEGAANVILPGATRYVRKRLERGLDVAKDFAATLKESATEIADTIKKSGLEPIKAQLTTSKRYRDLVADQIKSPPSLYSNSLKKKINQDFDNIRDEARSIITPEITKDLGERGVELANAMSDDLAVFVAPAKALYESAELKLLDASRAWGDVTGNNIIDVIAKKSNLDFGVKKEEFMNSLFRNSLYDSLNKMEEKTITKEGLNYIKDLDYMITRIDSFKKLDDSMSILTKKYGDRNFTDPELRKLNSEFRDKIRSELSKSYKTVSNIMDVTTSVDTVDNLLGVFTKHRANLEKLADYNRNVYSNYKKGRDFLSDLATELFQNKKMISKQLSEDTIGEIKINGMPSFSAIEKQLDNMKDMLERSLATQKQDGVIPLRKPLTNEGKRIIEGFIKDLNKEMAIYKRKDAAKLSILEAQQNVLEADKLYASGANVLKSLTTKSGRKDFKKTLNKQFKDFLDGTPDQDMVKKVLSFADINKAKKIREKAPRAFEVLRQAEIQKISEKIADDNDQRFINKLSTQLKNMPKEKALLLFGEDYADKLMGFRKYIETFPVTTNPSGTAHTLWDMLTKQNWLQSITESGLGLAGTIPASAVSRSRLKEMELLEKAADKAFTPKALQFMRQLDDMVSSISGRGVQAIGARQSILPLLPGSQEQQQPSILPGR